MITNGLFLFYFCFFSVRTTEQGCLQPPHERSGLIDFVLLLCYLLFRFLTWRRKDGGSCSPAFHLVITVASRERCLPYLMPRKFFAFVRGIPSVPPYHFHVFHASAVSNDPDYKRNGTARPRPLRWRLMGEAGVLDSNTTSCYPNTRYLLESAPGRSRQLFPGM